MRLISSNISVECDNSSINTNVVAIFHYMCCRSHTVNVHMSDHKFSHDKFTVAFLTMSNLKITYHENFQVHSNN